MSDLNAITNAVLENARTEKKQLIQEARTKGKKFVDKAKADAEKEIMDIEVQTEKEVRVIEENSRTEARRRLAMDFQQKKAELIEKLIKKAENHIYEMSGLEYNTFMTELLNKNAHKEKEGIIAFCEKDRLRINSELFSAIKKKGLEISDFSENIKGGFILKYGRIEENCSIEAILRDKRETIVDFLNKTLFE